MKAIETENLTKKYRNERGTENFSLTVEEGEIYGLLGPNGSGKTTAMKMLTGLISPDSGKYRIFERNPSEDISVMNRVGCIIETPAFYPQLTAYENLKILLRLYPDIPESRIGEITDELGLTKYKNECVKKFSLGMKQRLGLAAALINNPRLLILDEPANGLDIAGTAKMKKMLKDFANGGGAVLISSHITGDIQLLCTKAAVMENGKIIDVCGMETIMEKYGSVEAYYLSKTDSGGNENENYRNLRS